MLLASVLAAFALAAAPETAAQAPDAAPAAAAPAKPKKVCEKLPVDSTSRLRRSVCRTEKPKAETAAPAEAAAEEAKTPGA
jgi:hypothetical protein